MDLIANSKSLKFPVFFNLILASVYLLLAQSGMLFVCHHGNSTLWWPPGGFALAVLLIRGLIFVPGSFLGAFLTSVYLGDSSITATSIALGNTLELIIGWWLLNCHLPFNIAFNRLSDFLIILFITPIIALLGAAVDTSILVLAGSLEQSHWLQTAIHWWMADFLGMILITPLILVWKASSFTWPSVKRCIEITAILGLTFLAGQIIFLDWFHEYTSPYPQGFMMFLFLVITAMRLGLQGVLLVLIMTAIQALTGSIQGVGIFRNDIDSTHLTNFWLYMMVLSVMGIILAAYISEKNEYEENARYLGFYDSLTHLPNRRLFQDRVQQAIAESHRSKNHNALLFFDLDQFKTINDTLGHDQGDKLLRNVAKRLLSNVREGDTVSRLGGDEFVVLLKDLSTQAHEALFQAESASEKILIALNQTYILENNRPYHATASIGIALFSHQLVSFDELMKRADIAMYQAKKAGRNTFRFFDPKMQATVEARSILENGMRTALQEKQFRLHYQAQVDNSGIIYGAEALLRWQHPELGLVLPSEFIPLAEETGIIVQIGRWVLESACLQLHDWAQTPSTHHLQLAVNVSARQFWQQDFTEQVIDILQKTGINPSLLKLELTESMVLHNIDSVIEKMRAIKALGVQFSMDDFGTGHSSLSNLKKLPIDQLKIDRSFIMDITSDPDYAVIVQTIIAMADHLGIAVIAEGVENEQQQAFLNQQQCQNFQGFLFGKPVPIELFNQVILDTVI